MAIASVMTPLLRVEVTLRVRGYAPMQDTLAGKAVVLRELDDPDLRHDLRPNALGKLAGPRVQINSLGFRDDEVQLDKGAAARIICIGDSTTFGSEIERARTYPERLESALNADGTRRIEVLNLGVVGYDTVQEVRFLERRGLPLSPDVVVLGFCVNDLGIYTATFKHTWQEEHRDNPIYGLRTAQWVRQLRFERARSRDAAQQNDSEHYSRRFRDETLPIDDDQVLLQLMADLRSSGPRRGGGGRIEPWMHTEVSPSLYVNADRVGRLRYGFEQLAALQREHGFGVVVVVIPYLEDVQLFEGCYAIVEHLAQAQGFQVTSLHAAYRERGLERLRLNPSDPIHPGPEGHALIAEALEDLIRALGWIEGVGD